MALIDDIRRIAESKDTYNPGLKNVSAQPIGRKRVEPMKVAEILSRTNSPRISSSAAPTRGSGGVSLKDMADRAEKEIGENSFSLKDTATKTGGIALQGFGKLIDYVDTPRAAIVSGIKEATDIIPGFEGGDGSFDFGDWKQNAADNYGFGDLVEQVMGPEGTDRPMWLRRGLGFVGDVAADPLTYAGFGVVKHAAKGARGALDEALEGGARQGLAETVVTEAAKRGVKGDAVDRLAAEAGQRGRGAFTQKGLKRANVDADLPRQLGLTSEIGYRIGGPNGKNGVNIAGSRRLAEASENLKGSMKKALGGTSGAKTFRRLFSGDASALGQAERRFIDELITGAPNAATAARGLAALKLAKADSYFWMDDTAGGLSRDLPGLGKLGNSEASDITHLIEADMADGLSAEVKKWYDDVGEYLTSQGVEFNWRENYVNHMLTKRAWEAVRDGDERLIIHGLDTKEAFQKTRALTAGDDFLGETLKDGTIRELNEISNRVLGYDVFESDIRDLMGAYISQGQRALMRAKTYEYAGDLGITRQLDEAVDTERIAKEVSGQEDIIQAATLREGAALKAANKARKEALNDGAKAAKVARTQVARELGDVEKKLDDAGRRLLGLEDQITITEGRLGAAEVALRHWRGVLDSSKKANKGKAAALKGQATKQIRKLEQQVADDTASVAALRERIAKETDQSVKDDLKGEAARLGAQLDVEQQNLQGAQLAREALDDPSLPIPGTEVPHSEVVAASQRVADQRQEFLNETREYGAAANAFVWQQIDADTAVSALSNTLNKFDNVTEAAIFKGLPKGKSVDTVRDVRGELRDRVGIVTRAFNELGDEPVVASLRKTEAQAAAHDMQAWKASVSRSEARKQIDVLSDPNFQEYMTTVVADGFRKINDEVQVPAWFDDAMKLEAKMADAGSWEQMQGALRMYDKGMNVWKGYATASPGFVVRNAYSGFYNLYLDGVSPQSVIKFNRFLRRYHKDGADAAVTWAQKSGKYSMREIKNLQDSLKAASASGWGLTPQEVSTSLVGSKATLNPASAEFAPTRVIRSLSSDVEALLRGAHAYDVLQRGGDVNAAIARVEKFHFNYRDIGQFDRAAKRVSPFWTFYSRNMALQAEIWTRYPHKLNRSYFNVKRNMEIGTEEDEVVPGYYEEMGAIRTPFGDANGGRHYFTPDLPSLRFRQDIGQLTGTGGEGFDPLRMLSDTGPAIKVPVQLAANRNLFTNIPFKNRLYDYDSEGEIEGRKPPGLLAGKIPFTDTQVPVAGEIIKQASDKLLPGTRIVNGDLLMQDNTQSAVEDFLPLLGRQTRLDPQTDKYNDRLSASLLSFMGAPVKTNTEQSIQGELYGRQKDSEDQIRRQRILEMLENNLK